MITRTSTLLLLGLQDSTSHVHWQEFDGRYRPLLLNVGRRLGLSDADAQDAAQDSIAAFIVEYRAGRYQRDRGRLRDWLAAIMSHKVRDLQRKRMRQDSLLQQNSAHSPPDPCDESTLQHALDLECRHAILRQCLEDIRLEVPSQMFESFELLALKQFPAREVARRLGISADLVYQNKHRVLQRIRQLLAQWEDAW